MPKLRNKVAAEAAAAREEDDLLAGGARRQVERMLRKMALRLSDREEGLVEDGSSLMMAKILRLPVDFPRKSDHHQKEA